MVEPDLVVAFNPVPGPLKFVQVFNVVTKLKSPTNVLPLHMTTQTDLQERLSTMEHIIDIHMMKQTNLFG